jgi:TetR/AcrR family transcriptional regulator, repressor for neighboring sulfatase
MTRERRIARRERRRRRTPEQARVELLDAAERVFAQANPRDVGLKNVAREAGVSHALITHYFGTYAGLVEATLERRIRRLRERILAELRKAGAISRPGELLAMLFEALQDPVHLRLVKWLVASERPGSAFALQDRGLQVVAREVAAALHPKASSAIVDAIEVALVTAVAAAYGYAATKPALAGAIGRPPSAALDVEVQRTLAGMLEHYVRALIPS